LNILTPQDLETFDEGAYDKYMELLKKFVNIKSSHMVYDDPLETHTKFGLKLLECKNILPRSFGVRFLKRLKSESRSDRKLIESLSTRLTQVLFNDPHEKILNESEGLILDILREPSKTRKQLLKSILKSLIDCKDKTIFKPILDVVKKLLEKYEDEMLKLLREDFNKNRDTARLEEPRGLHSSAEKRADFFWLLIFDQRILLRNELLSHFIALLNDRSELKRR